MKSITINWALPIALAFSVWFLLVGWVDWQVVLLLILFGIEINTTWEVK